VAGLGFGGFHGAFTGFLFSGAASGGKRDSAPPSRRAAPTQLQYSQTVLLNFNTLSWPHVTVGTLRKS
jgi:hypothetical protein